MELPHRGIHQQGHLLSASAYYRLLSLSAGYLLSGWAEFRLYAAIREDKRGHESRGRTADRLIGASSFGKASEQLAVEPSEPHLPALGAVFAILLC